MSVDGCRRSTSLQPAVFIDCDGLVPPPARSQKPLVNPHTVPGCGHTFCWCGFQACLPGPGRPPDPASHGAWRTIPTPAPAPTAPPTCTPHSAHRDCVIDTLEGPGIVKSECPQCHQPAWKKDLQPCHKYSNLLEGLARLRQCLPDVPGAAAHGAALPTVVVSLHARCISCARGCAAAAWRLPVVAPWC